MKFNVVCVYFRIKLKKGGFKLKLDQFLDQLKKNLLENRKKAHTGIYADRRLLLNNFFFYKILETLSFPNCFTSLSFSGGDF